MKKFKRRETQVGKVGTREKACMSNRVLQRFLKIANVEDGNQGNEELVAHVDNLR